MRFTKMQGLGNDYLYVEGSVPPDIAALSRRLSNRHFGPGADGMIYIAPSSVADFSMRIFNADGSEAMMCGNGIRCVGKYVYDHGLTDKTSLSIETRAGLRRLTLHCTDGEVDSVTVDMGRAIVSPEITLDVDGDRCILTPVSVGNPHAVLFVGEADAAPLTTLGPRIERHPAFPDGVNVEFVSILAPDHLRMRVWERGSGVTMACGTGACAAAAAAVALGDAHPDAPITVDLDGGSLTIAVAADGTVSMTGPAVTVYTGEI